MSEAGKTIAPDNEPTTVLSAKQLQDLGQRILDSGVLGRSRYYRQLFEFLLQCSMTGRLPRELDIAQEALGKDADFDVSSDSTVRVYVHQLRKKLDNYYQEHEPDASVRLGIARGQYRLTVERNSEIAQPGFSFPFWRKSSALLAMLAVVAVLLIANLFVMLRPGQAINNSASNLAAAHPVWQTILADEQPILLVMGDYYIFGELNANGNVARMVREFNVNSSNDLEELRFSEFERAANYLDLDLSYMPEGSAFALSKVVPILETSSKPVNIIMMSDLSMADIRSNHIVYIGYISALDKLSELTFNASELSIGRSYDELINKRTAQYYTSDAGLPEQGQRFRDYGLFMTYPVSASTQVVLVSGMRDAGVMHMAQALSSVNDLDTLLSATGSDASETASSFEALYEVYGVDRMSFDARLVHAAELNREAIWRSDAANLQAIAPL